ncbi:hypothetical protein Tco_1258794, partial [Tanacetum coccineum]
MDRSLRFRSISSDNCLMKTRFRYGFGRFPNQAIAYKSHAHSPKATRLYIGDTHIWSATGVQQCGTLRPLLFALVLHPLVHKIIDNCKFLLHAWYLDDGAVIRDSEEVARVLIIIRVSGPCLGLEINIKKTEIFWPSCNGTKLREGLFPVTIRRPSLGVKLLGGAVSRDTYFISRLAMRRAANVIDLMGLLSQLHDPLSELLLLRSCIGLRGLIENMVVCGGPFFEDLQWRLASLPIRFDGLSFCFTNKDTTPFKAQQTLVSALISEMVKDMEVHFDMTMRQNAVFECLHALHAQDFLLAILIDRICQHMSPACLDSFGEHAVHCKELSGFKYRHDMVRDVLFGLCRRAGISAKKEAHTHNTKPLPDFTNVPYVKPSFSSVVHGSSSTVDSRVPSKIRSISLKEQDL